MRRIAGIAVIITAFLCATVAPVAAQQDGFTYRTPEEINSSLKNLAKENKSLARLHNLGKTPGGRDLLLLELGKKDSDLPAILTVANMEGNYPIAGEAALELARLLVTDWSDELDSHTWYIMAAGNPDGSARFFESPKRADYGNERPVNDDKDDAFDEDGPEDLNGDGFITKMRQVHPEGKWIAVDDNPVLLKKADGPKGETGKYRLFTEGIDNDGDGEINEDGPGGVNPGYNFPHNFQHYTNADGLWAASEAESRAILRFTFDHPRIAMTLFFGRSNSLKSVPEGKKAQAAQDKYKVPERMANRMGLDPEKEYPLKELVEMAREYSGYKELTEEMVLQFLGAGAAMSPNKDDLSYWNEISERYNDFIKEAKLDGKRLDPPSFPTGSIDEWAYYQFGVPSFSMDFWTLPIVEKKEEKKEGELTPEDVEKMSNDEFIELGAEKIDAFLKASGAPPQFTADQVIMALKGGMMDTGKMAEMMRKNKKKEESGGADETEQALFDFNPEAFVTWQEYDHPTLGTVEIGGMKPYATVLPPTDSVSDLISRQLPFIRQLAGLLPGIAIDKINVEKKGAEVWKLEVWVVNKGFLPYPTHQGKRCQRPTPTVVTVSGNSMVILEGRERKVLGLLEGSGGTEKAVWLIKASEGTKITVKADGFSAGSDTKAVVLKGGQR